MTFESTYRTGRPADGLVASDVRRIIDADAGLWRSLRHSHIFLTGGTGFIGTWLLEALHHADRTLGLDLKATILTRDPARFAIKAPHLAAWPGFSFVTGDVLSSDVPAGPFTHLIHAATDASAALNERDPLAMFDTIVSGTRWALELVRLRGIPRTLFMSSGAVYGQQPWELERMPETWSGGPICTNPLAAYAEGKRAAEMLCAIYARQFGLDIVTARIFALLGPHIELGIHFAAGNFIRDAMQGRPVVVKGDGRPCRSYLYASDLTAWLLAMLVKARPGAVYNVGSDQSVSIAELARRTSDLLGGDGVTILGAQDPGWNPGRYVPDTSLIRSELGVQQTQSLDEAILRTALWNGWEPKSPQTGMCLHARM